MPSHADEVIDTLARRQLGLVTRMQLLAGGVSRETVAARVRARRFRPVHRGVYLVGPIMVPRAREMAAVLACGPSGVLSDESAAVLWELASRPEACVPVDVTVERGDRGRRPGIRVHRRTLHTDEVTTLHGIPVTTPSRTLRDLAAVLGRRELEQALAKAERRELVDRSKLLAEIGRDAGRRGARLLRALLAAEGSPALTRSAAEERFLALVRKAGIPAPASNVSIGGYEVDFLWRRERLVVEVDGFAFHTTQQKFESDRRRDARLTARGLRIMRVTWRQLVNEPEAVLVRLGQSLVQ